MQAYIYRCVLYLSCFMISFWALMGIDFEKIIRKGRTRQAQILLWILSMAIGYLVAQFMMGLIYRNIFF